MLRSSSAGLFVSSLTLVVATFSACTGDDFTPLASGPGGASASGGEGGAGPLGGAAGAVPGGAAGTEQGGGAGQGGAEPGGTAGASGAAGESGKSGAAGTASGAGGTAGSSGDVCATNDDCAALAGDCRKGTCAEKVCVFANDDTKLPPDQPKDCAKPACAEGVPTTKLDLGDVPDPEGTCYVGACKPDGTPGVAPGNDGKSCGDAKFCAKGLCVQCDSATPCPTYPLTDCRRAMPCANGVCAVVKNELAQPDANPTDCVQLECAADGSVTKIMRPKDDPCGTPGLEPGKCDGNGSCLAE